MKPPPFAYHAPTSTAEALDTLAELGHDGKVLAGGQSLIPLLNMRLAAPGALVDINRIESLQTLQVRRSHREDRPPQIVIGAGVRQAAALADPAIRQACPLIAQALQLVAHPVIRNRGTVCGSIAHADPSGEMTAVMALLGGTVQVQRKGQPAQDVGAGDFFVAPLESALEPCDLVTSVTLPGLPDGAGSAFTEIARRHGDYALSGVGAVVGLDDDGAITSAKIAAISVHPTPLVVDVTELLVGCRADLDTATEDALQQAAALVDERSEPEADLHATVSYRRQLTRVLTVRALRAAAENARQRSNPPGAVDTRTADV